MSDPLWIFACVALFSLCACQLSTGSSPEPTTPAPTTSEPGPHSTPAARFQRPPPRKTTPAPAPSPAVDEDLRKQVRKAFGGRVAVDCWIGPCSILVREIDYESGGPAYAVLVRAAQGRARGIALVGGLGAKLIGAGTEAADPRGADLSWVTRWSASTQPYHPPAGSREASEDAADGIERVTETLVLSDGAQEAIVVPGDENPELRFRDAAK